MTKLPDEHEFEMSFRDTLFIEWTEYLHRAIFSVFGLSEHELHPERDTVDADPTPLLLLPAPPDARE